MNTKRPARHVIDMLFVLALFLLFALSATALIVLGADVYERNASRMEDNYSLRTAGAYLTEKLRRTQVTGSVAIGEIDGRHALLLCEDINGISFTTYLYVHDGELTELFARSELDPPASSGTGILPVMDIRFSFDDDHLLRITLTETGGHTHDLLLSIRQKGGTDDE